MPTVNITSYDSDQDIHDCEDDDSVLLRMATDQLLCADEYEYEEHDYQSRHTITINDMVAKIQRPFKSIFYGQTNSGKTELILNILKRIAHHYSGIFIFCGSVDPKWERVLPNAYIFKVDETS